MTDEQLAEIEARANAATAGPWGIERDPISGMWTVFDTDTKCGIIDKENSGCASDPCPDDVGFSRENAAFIAAAKSDIPALIAEVRRLKEELELSKLELACEHSRGCGSEP